MWWLAGRLVKDTSSWNNKKESLESERSAEAQLRAALAELDEEGMAARVRLAQEERDAAHADHQAAVVGVRAAESELAGAEAGDGRDASNRSLQERLADARNAQVCRGRGVWVGGWVVACWQRAHAVPPHAHRRPRQRQRPRLPTRA